jgi:hypothetical protein
VDFPEPRSVASWRIVDRILTFDEVAQLLGIHKVTVRRPARRAKCVEAIKYKVKNLTTPATTHLSLRTLLLRVTSVLRG